MCINASSIDCPANACHCVWTQVGADHFYTSALATAAFLAKQKPYGSAYVIGEPGLIRALYDAGSIPMRSTPRFLLMHRVFVRLFDERHES